MACEPNDLLDLARCFSCLSAAQHLEIQTYLLCQLVAGGGTGGGAVEPGAVDPEGSVTGTPGQTYFNSTNGTFWVKSSGSGNTGWVQLI